jgi:hypothetical protein
LQVIPILNRNFEGPYEALHDLRHAAGIYVITDTTTDGTFVLDVGQAGDIKERIENHDRKACWGGNANGRIGAAVLYTPGWTEAQRCLLERQIRDEYTPCCGVR